MIGQRFVCHEEQAVITTGTLHRTVYVHGHSSHEIWSIVFSLWKTMAISQITVVSH